MVLLFCFCVRRRALHKFLLLLSFVSFRLECVRKFENSESTGKHKNVRIASTSKDRALYITAASRCIIHEVKSCAVLRHLRKRFAKLMMIREIIIMFIKERQNERCAKFAALHLPIYRICVLLYIIIYIIYYKIFAKD